MTDLIEELTSDAREDLFRILMNDVVLPQRRRLLQFRDLSWQSAYVDDDGYLAELIASIVTGIPGRSRHGVSRSSGDLADETEVKKGYRLDPNIDFLLRGSVDRTRRLISLRDCPPELRLAEIVDQLNSNASSVQLLSSDPECQFIGGPIARTVSKNALRITNGVVELSLSQRRPLSEDTAGQDVVICIRQERGHINFGNRTRAEIGSVLKSRPVLVFYQHDQVGRASVAVTRCDLDETQIEELLDRIYGSDELVRKQLQPYLFTDNERGSLSTSPKHSVAFALGGRLLAFGVETRRGFVVKHWDPEGLRSVADCESVLTARAPSSECPDFWHSSLPFDLSTEEGRQDSAEAFFLHCMDGYYNEMKTFCQLTATSRNFAFGNLSQHLVSLLTGVRGTRSGARGADLVESDGTPSEVKLATGISATGLDAMGTEDSPRLTLGWDLAKMLTWKRLFAVRIVDIGTGIRVLVHAPTQETMDRFRDQAITYFDGRVNNGSGGLQYHTPSVFPHDQYGTRDRRLEFVRVGDFGSGSAVPIPNEIPAF